MDAGKRLSHFVCKTPMCRKAQCCCDQHPVKKAGATIINTIAIFARPRRQQQQIFGYESCCGFQRVKIVPGLWCCAGMKPAQIVLHHVQHLLRGVQRIFTIAILVEGGEDIGMPCIQKVIGLSYLRGAAVRIPERVGMGEPFLFRPGPQAKTEFWAQPLPGGQIIISVCHVPPVSGPTSNAQVCAATM